MTADGVIPGPERQRAVHRHAQDSPSLAELVAALERTTQAAFKGSADALQVANETRKLLAALRRLAALADGWETESALNRESPAPFTRGIAKGYELAAARLRDAITKGVPE